MKNEKVPLVTEVFARVSIFAKVAHLTIDITNPLLEKISCCLFTTLIMATAITHSPRNLWCEN